MDFGRREIESELVPSMLCIHLARNGATPSGTTTKKEQKRTELEVDMMYLMKEHTYSYEKLFQRIL